MRACLVNLDSGLNISTLLTIWNAPCLLFSTGFWPAQQPRPHLKLDLKTAVQHNVECPAVCMEG